MDALKELALCQFEFLECSIRSVGLAHMLSMFEVRSCEFLEVPIRIQECMQQVLHHDLEVLCMGVSLCELITRTT